MIKFFMSNPVVLSKIPSTLEGNGPNAHDLTSFTDPMFDTFWPKLTHKNSF